MTLEVRCPTEERTRACAASLARRLRGGELIGLRGELGAGKTAFVRGLATGLGVLPERVRSPTFTLINEYEGGRLPLYHIDLYRMAPTGVDRMALREYLYGFGVCAVEWIERLGEEAPSLDLTLSYAGDDERVIRVTTSTPRYRSLVTREIWGDDAISIA